MAAEDIASAIRDLEERHRALLRELAQVETAIAALEALRAPQLPLEAPPDRADVGSAKWRRQQAAAAAPPPATPRPGKAGVKPRLNLDKRALDAQAREILGRRGSLNPIALSREMGLSRYAGRVVVEGLLRDEVLVAEGRGRGMQLRLAPARPPVTRASAPPPTVCLDGVEYEPVWSGAIGRQGKSISSVGRE